MDLLDTVRERSLLSDCLYDISKNKQIIESEVFESVMTSLFMYFYEKGELENAVYSWLDGWDDGWSTSPEKLHVKILGSYVDREYAPQEFRLKMKNVFENVVPYFGETEILSYYKKLLKDDFNVF